MFKISHFINRNPNKFKKNLNGIKLVFVVYRHTFFINNYKYCACACLYPGLDKNVILRNSFVTVLSSTVYNNCSFELTYSTHTDPIDTVTEFLLNKD